MKKLIGSGLMLAMIVTALQAGPQAEQASKAVEIPIERDFTAKDLTVQKLRGERTGDAVRFTLDYTSGINRFVSFFNPPDGNPFMFFMEDGLRPGDSSVSFLIPVEDLQRAQDITIRLSDNRNEEADRNFFFIDLNSSGYRKLLDPKVPRTADSARKRIVIQATARNGIDKPADTHGLKAPVVSSDNNKSAEQPVNSSAFKPYDDVRKKDVSADPAVDAAMIATFWFNGTTTFGGQSRYAAEILESAKDPGLGIKGLHTQGITGAGVNVAIIDQNLAGAGHPEYAGKVAEYFDAGCGQPSDRGSMHGPAVLSLLVGETTGTAPGAKVYYAAAPSWTGDAAFQAQALDWIIARNRTLPPGKKIRVVSVSAAPSGPGSPFTKNNAEWDRSVRQAEAEGMLVLDCTQDHGFIGPAYFTGADRNSASGVAGGFPGSPFIGDSNSIAVPCSPRTTAEEYEAGSPGYQYTGRGGLSWSIPYTAGVLAMGWQLRPELSGDQMKRLLMETREKGANGSLVISPAGFIEAVKKAPAAAAGGAQAGPGSNRSPQNSVRDQVGSIRTRSFSEDLRFRLTLDHMIISDVAVDASGCLYVSGGKGSPGKDAVAYIDKITTEGTLDTGFRRTYADSIIQSIAMDRNGALYILGVRSGGTDGKFVTWIEKIDTAERKTIWLNEYRLGNTMSPPQRNAIGFDASGNVYYAASAGQADKTTVNQQEAGDWYLGKLTPDGKPAGGRWPIRVDSGNGLDWPISLAVSPDSSVYVSGIGNYVDGSVQRSVNGLDYDWWVKKYDPEGNELPGWDKRIDGRGGWDWAYSLAFAGNGDVFVCGFGEKLLTATSGYDAWIKRFTSDGKEYPDWNILPGKKMNFSDICLRGEDTIQASGIGPDGSLIITGYCVDGESEFSYISALDSSGEITASVTMRDAAPRTRMGIKNMVLTPDGAVVVGYTGSMNTGIWKGFIRKFFR